MTRSSPSPSARSRRGARGTSSASIELSSAYVARAATLTHTGSRGEADAIVESRFHGQIFGPSLTTSEAAEYQAHSETLTASEFSWRRPERYRQVERSHDWARAMITHAGISGRGTTTRRVESWTRSPQVTPDKSQRRNCATGSRGTLLPLLQALPMHPSPPRMLESLPRGKRRTRWTRSAQLIAAFAGPRDELSRATEALAPYPWHLTLLADLMVRRLARPSPEASKVVMTAAKLTRSSWRRRSENRN